MDKLTFILLYIVVALILAFGLIIAGDSYDSYRGVDGFTAQAAEPTIKKERLKINVGTGAEGSATGNATTESVIQGRIIRVDIDFGAGITTTTDLTLVQANELVATNILNLSNTATDVVVYPQVQVVDNTNTGLTYDGTRAVTDYYPVADKLTLTIAQTEVATPAVTVDIYWSE